MANSSQLTVNSSQLTADSFYLLTTFPPTVTDPSLSLQDDVLWSSTSLRGDAYRQSSFWTVARMPCGKDGKQQHDTEWRIYYFEWHLTTFLITVTDLSHSLRMTSYGFLHHSSKSSTSLRGDAYPHSYKNTVPITSDKYRILCFLSYFLTLAFHYAFGEIWEPYTSR